MHVRVRLVGRPESIVVVESKLTKIQEFRRLIKEKFDVAPKLQRLFYGGKLLEDGYTFHDYNIKLNDVIQLMLRADPLEDTTSKVTEILQNDSPKEDSKPEIAYEDAICSLYAVGDLIDMKDREQGAWFEGKIERIVQDPDYVHLELTSTSNEIKDSNKENATENKLPQEKAKEPSSEKKKSKGLADYFQKAKAKKTQSENSSCSNQVENSSKGLLYKILLEADADSEDSKSETYYCKLTEIRPRARKEIDIKELKVGQMIMINHNTEEHLEKGFWYDYKVAEIKKLRTSYELVGTLYLGPEAVPQNETKARVHDKIYAIEHVVPLSQRSEEYKKLMVTPTERRSSPLNCVHCRDDEDAPCKECGCYICLGKVNPEKIILCDECNHGYHMGCLSPPLTALPADEEEWYCAGCKRDATAVVAPGAAKQRKKTAASTSTRDWGRGMACVGKTKSSAMPANHFGPIPGIEVGMCWRFRIQLSESGVHRPPVSGIHGRDVEGAYSIVLSGGYEDDYDNGDEFTYTGSGGRDLSGNKRTAEQSCDQTLTRENKALARNCAVKQVSEEGGDSAAAWREGRPVRVVRSYKMTKHFPQFAPKEGIRYDGIYKVVKYYPEKGKSGFRVWKYLLRRDDPTPAPWEEGAKQYPTVYPDGYLEAEAEKKALKEKGGKGGKGGKVGKGGKKRTVERSPTSGGEAGAESPPTKRRKTRAKPELSPKVKENVAKSPRTSKIADIFTPAKKSPKTKEASDEQPLMKEEMEAIKADELNSKLWDECLATCKEGGKKEFVERVTQVFLCIICQDVAASPVTTACLHNFCQGCLKLAFRSTGARTCPCCRRDLSKEQSRLNEALQTALRTVMPGYDAGKK